MSQTATVMALDCRHEVDHPGHTYTGVSRGTTRHDTMYASTPKCGPGGKIGLLNTAYPELLRAFMGKADAEEGTLGTAGP